MNTFDNIQRREVIDEDKKIYKRSLDIDFSFLKRLGEETLPSTDLDKRTEFNIIKAIEDVAVQIAGVGEELSRIVDANPDEVGKVDINLGPTIKYWNILVGYIKSFVNLNRLSQAQYEDIWQKIDSRITSGVNFIADAITYFDGVNIEYEFPEKEEFELLYNYLQDRNLSPIVIQLTEANRRPIEKSFESIAQRDARLRQEEQQLQRELVEHQAELEQQQAEAEEIQQAVEEPAFQPLLPGVAHAAQGAIAAQAAQAAQAPPKPKRGRPPKNKPVGEGKPKQMKKKMGDDDNELNIISFDSRKTKEHLNNMKKPEKKMPLLFNDSNDNNYL
jgi:hypothetical protein